MNNIAEKTMSRLQKFKANKDQVILDIIRYYSPEITDLNVEQMQAGLREDGKRITPEYSPITVRIKRLKGQLYTHVTLHDEGDFQGGIEIVFGSDHFYMTSTDEKTQELIDKYGQEIFGLMRISWEELEEMIMGQLKEYLDKNVIYGIN